MQFQTLALMNLGFWNNYLYNTVHGIAYPINIFLELGTSVPTPSRAAASLKLTRLAFLMLLLLSVDQLLIWKRRLSPDCGWRLLEPGGRDPVAPLKATMSLSRSQVVVAPYEWAPPLDPVPGLIGKWLITPHCAQIWAALPMTCRRALDLCDVSINRAAVPSPAFLALRFMFKLC